MCALRSSGHHLAIGIVAIVSATWGCAQPTSESPRVETTPPRTSAAARRPDPAELVEAMLTALPPLPRRVAAIHAGPRDPGCPEWLAATAALDAATREGRYIAFTSGPFVVRLPAAEAVVMQPYVADLVERASQLLTQRYGEPVDAQVLIDFYDDARAFRERLGASASLELDGAYCDGAIALLSPTGGAGNWGETLVHEMAHAFQQTVARGRVPTWLAEGLSETDTFAVRREWRRELEGDAKALLSTAPPRFFEALERSLTAPRSPSELGIAYVVAAEVVAGLRVQHGDEALRVLLRRYAQGDDDDAALRAATGATPAALAAGLGEALRARSPGAIDRGLPALDASGSADDTLARAVDALLAGRRDEARAGADASLLERPADPTALYVRARATLLERDPEAELYLQRMVDAGHDAYELRIALARVALSRGDVSRATENVEAALRMSPERLAGWDLCLRLADRRAATMTRGRCAPRLADLDQRSADLTMSLMTDALAREDWVAAKTYGERLLYMVPSRRALHVALARAYEALGARDLADRERRITQALERRLDGARAP